MSLALMCVHAHPDDEAIATGGVLARAADEGMRTAVATATGDERGEMVREGMDPNEIRPRLAQVPCDELTECPECRFVLGPVAYERMAMAGDAAGAAGSSSTSAAACSAHASRRSPSPPALEAASWQAGAAVALAEGGRVGCAVVCAAAPRVWRQFDLPGVVPATGPPLGPSRGRGLPDSTARGLSRLATRPPATRPSANLTPATLTPAHLTTATRTWRPRQVR